MAISETAQKNHDQLFPGHVSTLKVTDPELIEVFDNFAFDETLTRSGLDIRTRLMVQLAALIAARALSEYRVMLGAALAVGVTPVEAKEIVYQAVPYAGMGQGLRLHPRHQRRPHRARRRSCRSTGSPRPRPPPAPSGAARCRSRSSARTGCSGCTRRRPVTSCTSRSSCPPTASATTSPAPGSTCRCASCSRSPCSSPSAAATPRSGGTWRPTSTSATTGRR